MENNSYPYDNSEAARYTFTSIGKKHIFKQVVFTHTGIHNIVNMGFGDILPDSTIDDKANSNNGDIVKVLATTIHISKDFASKFPDMEIFFTGSTQERTNLYTHILRTYYSEFRKEFTINGIVKEGNGYAELPFEPKTPLRFAGFIIKRVY